MHLFALIPSQGASQLLRQLADVLGKRSNNSRRVLAGDLDEHREAGIALDEGGDVRIVRSGKKVSFPMPRPSAILNLGGPLADGDHIEDMPLPTVRVVALGVTHPSRGRSRQRTALTCGPIRVEDSGPPEDQYAPGQQNGRMRRTHSGKSPH